MRRITAGTQEQCSQLARLIEEGFVRHRLREANDCWMRQTSKGPECCPIGAATISLFDGNYERAAYAGNHTAHDLNSSESYAAILGVPVELVKAVSNANLQGIPWREICAALEPEPVIATSAPAVNHPEFCKCEPGEIAGLNELTESLVPG